MSTEKRIIFTGLQLRLYRAESWLKCSEHYAEDHDMAFIAQWIAFNSCYLTDRENQERICERESFKNFIRILVDHDDEKRIEACLWDNFSGFIRTLIGNKYVYHRYWIAKWHTEDAVDWETSFKKSQETAKIALMERNVEKVMSVVLDRLYCLRNQLMHGGASYGSSVNRQQVKDGKKMLSELMPIVIDIMKSCENGHDWGNVSYPVIEE